MTSSAARRYRDARRRLLVDMHIPDWDDGFLAQYDPRSIAEAAKYVGAEAVMLYFQSHLGLTYYPSQVGARHRMAFQRDLAGEALAALLTDDIPVCAYYSVNFNNRAWLDHPEWRLQPSAPTAVGILPRERYGIVCLNHPDYRAFVQTQIAEIVAYPVDALFFDMVWWNGICTCPACRSRFRDENGSEIPKIVDWRSPDWVRFQACREDWLTQFAVWLRSCAQTARPGVDVYHNFALGLSNWTRGVTFDSVAGHDFLGGDFYGGRAEQLVITRLMLNLTPCRPAEFMTTAASNLTEHVRLRSVGQLRTKALAAAVSDAAFLAIVAIDPAGTIDPEALARVKAGFDATRAFDTFRGGEPIEEIGLYCSDYSKMGATAAPIPIAEAPAASLPDYPHFTALVGAARIIQEAHIPFGVVTRRDLKRLDRWPVIVLPNVERMSAEEVEALRAYVVRGGRVYASRSSSLCGIEGEALGDFALADLFGAHYDGEEGGRLIYARAADRIEPFRPLAHWRPSDGRAAASRLSGGDGEVLVFLTLPYGHPHPGHAGDTNWASIHSSPPWTDTQRPLVVRKRHGRGITIYSAFEIEAGASAEHDALFLSILLELLPQRPLVRAQTHQQIWMTVFGQPGRLTITLLNYPIDGDALPVPSCRVRLRYPASRIHEVRNVPGLERMEICSVGDDEVEIEAGPVELCKMLIVELNQDGP